MLPRLSNFLFFVCFLGFGVLGCFQLITVEKTFCALAVLLDFLQAKRTFEIHSNYGQRQGTTWVGKNKHKSRVATLFYSLDILTTSNEMGKWKGRTVSYGNGLLGKQMLRVTSPP